MLRSFVFCLFLILSPWCPDDAQPLFVCMHCERVHRASGARCHCSLNVYPRTAYARPPSEPGHTDEQMRHVVPLHAAAHYKFTISQHGIVCAYAAYAAHGRTSAATEKENTLLWNNNNALMCAVCSTFYAQEKFIPIYGVPHCVPPVLSHSSIHFCRALRSNAFQESSPYAVRAHKQ